MNPLRFHLLQVKFGMAMPAAGLPSLYVWGRLRKTFASFLRQMGNRHGYQYQKVATKRTKTTQFQAIVARSGEQCHLVAVGVMASQVTRLRRG